MSKLENAESIGMEYMLPVLISYIGIVFSELIDEKSLCEDPSSPLYQIMFPY